MEERDDSMEEQMKEKRVADSLTEQFHEIRPEHLNGAGVMFGGVLMGWYYCNPSFSRTCADCLG
mgnify:CR=1 FL=1